MEELLYRELECLETWPKDVRQGVELLAWIVSRACIKVRAAFRVYGQTSNPLCFDSSEDGYVYEKWGVHGYFRQPDLHVGIFKRIPAGAGS